MDWVSMQNKNRFMRTFPNTHLRDQKQRWQGCGYPYGRDGGLNGKAGEGDYEETAVVWGHGDWYIDSFIIGI